MIFQVEDFQVRDHSFAIKEHLQDIFNAEITEIEANSVSGMQMIQCLHKFMGCHHQEFWDIGTHRREVRIVQRRIACRPQVSNDYRLRIELVHSFHQRFHLPAFLMVRLRIAVSNFCYADLHQRKQTTMNEF